MAKGEFIGRRAQLSWMRTLRVGDVIARVGGPWRIVRELSRYRNGDLRCVTFTIRSCSWTHRCYTVYGYNDLRMMGYRKIAVKTRRLRSGWDRKIDAAIHQNNHPAQEPHLLTCCDVEGTS